MKIFKNTSGYAPLIPNLEGHWEKQFAELPSELGVIVEKQFVSFPWDSLDVANRRNLAAQQDYQHDPNLEPATYFELLGFSQELEDWIKEARQKQENAVAVALRDVADRIKEILEGDRKRVGSEIQELRVLKRKTEQADFDKAELTYPEELDMAFQAWRAVSTTKGKGTPKARIRVWLDKNTHFSLEAKERISMVANWNKLGGAARSD